MASLSAVFKAYDIRGTVPDQLNEVQFRAIGMAAARFAKSPTMLVGRDMRESGKSLSAAFAEGVRSEGVTVVDLGLASTDLLYFAAGSLDAPGAMFTASHNPARYNGLKLCLSGARPVGRDTGLAEIEQVAEEILDDWGRGGPPALDPSSLAPLEHRDLLPEYADHVRSFVDLRALRPLRIVADTANGMGGLVVPVVFEGLPFHVEILFGELDGTFPNHPADPIQPENLKALRQAVLAGSADVGLAFDGDADRVFLVDERAEPVSGSLDHCPRGLLDAGQVPRVHGALQLHLLPGGARDDRGQGRKGCPHQGRSQLHQAGDVRDGRRLRRRALGPLLLP